MKKINLIFSLLVLVCACSENTDNDTTKHEKQNIDSLKQLLKVESQKTSNDLNILAITNELLKTDSSDYDIWKCRAESFGATKQYDNAFYAVNKAISINPNGYIYHVKGMLYTYTFNDDSADFYLRKAERLSSNLQYLYKLYYYYKSKEYNQKAINVMDTAIKKYPKELTLYAYKATCLLEIEKWEEALKCFNIAEESYKYDELYFGRGVAYFKLNKFNESLKDFNTAIEKNPNISYYFYNRSLLKYKLKDIQGALQDGKRAYEMGDQNALIEYPKLVEKVNKTKNI